MFKAQTKILKTCHATTTQLKCAEKYHLGENEQRSQIGATNFATDLKVWGSGLPLTLFQHLSTLCVIVLVCCFYFPISMVLCILTTYILYVYHYFFLVTWLSLVCFRVPQERCFSTLLQPLYGVPWCFDFCYCILHGGSDIY